MKICEHLESILNYELKNGNSIRETNSDTWTNAELVINLNNPINKVYASIEIQKSKNIQYFHITDTHYELQEGYFCRICKHSIAGPKQNQP